MFNGKNTKIFQKNDSFNSEEGYKPCFKQSRFETSSDTLMYILLGIGLACSFSLSLLFWAEKNSFVLRFIEEKTIGFNYFKKFMSFFSVCMNSITFMVYTIVDFYLFVISLTTKTIGMETNVEGTQVGPIIDSYAATNHLSADSMGRRGFTMINSESNQENLGMGSLSNVPVNNTTARKLVI
jgi:hypothetical protein